VVCIAGEALAVQAHRLPVRHTRGEIRVRGAPDPRPPSGGAGRRRDVGGKCHLGSDPAVERRPMTDRHDVVWARRETDPCLRNTRGTGAGARLDPMETPEDEGKHG